jgi:hypothetical protein
LNLHPQFIDSFQISFLSPANSPLPFEEPILLAVGGGRETGERGEQDQRDGGASGHGILFRKRRRGPVSGLGKAG